MPVKKIVKSAEQVVVEAAKPTKAAEPKAILSAAEVLGSEEIKTLVDEIATSQAVIAKKMLALQPMIADMNEKKEELLRRIESVTDAGVSSKVKGHLFVAEFSAKTLQRTITDIKLVAKLMKDTFWKVAKVNLKDVDDYLTPEERANVISESREKGSRSLKFKPLVDAKKDAVG